ncbi:protein translocase subunit SecD [Polynucleobacter sp. Tro8-14-1]|jgi:preprotein translocase subunit SecD|uniref:protein translocase subunit SecD n=1 Tax=Polynucleobacter sp. Tro8-14-1 TaxID=1758383 RepID=UPI001C0D377F|nr:protein translocase subunit SecD [Polynucleobacter sp. Tro8-14-1]MBU3562406.1 protein translocase subunit SecD [Polynucleobacter sp. Tro8-14-1]
MNRYPLWKYLVIAVALLIGGLYSLPNFYGEAPAVQVSSAKPTIKVDLATQARVEKILAEANINNTGLFFEVAGNVGSIKVRFNNTDIQLRARDLLQQKLNVDQNDPNYTVALNLLSNTPGWLSAINALPMPLGLDLRGGVYFLLQVDMKGAVQKKVTSLAGDIRSQLRDKSIRHQGIERGADFISINFANVEDADQARAVLTTGQPELIWLIKSNGSLPKLVGEFKPAALKAIQDNAVKQNIITLNKRVNELAVKEPVIQQQGAERIVVQLPGVQDTARAKDIIGRTATLESRLADPLASTISLGETPPPGMDTFRFGENRLGVFKKSVIFSGDRITDASAGFDQNQRPAVNISLDAAGGRVMQEVTRENIGKPMGMILFEKDKGEVLTIATIQSEFGSKFQITGQPTTESANDLALLLRAGSLAAPMEIIEERTIGPSLGAENIEKGFKSLLIGFTAIAIFMMVYYLLFGTFSVVALAVNLLLLISVLSMLQATLTLPGIAAMALALGMAIDSNVLINERIREELRNGASPQTAISVGFDKAWATILDSNVTTLIAGLALLAFGSGPIKGFAVVHCLGILTSMFSAVFFSRGLVNLWYGRHKKIQKLAIGQVWRPQEK